MQNSTRGAGPAGGRSTHRGMRRLAVLIAAGALAVFMVGFATPSAPAVAAPYGHCDSVDNTAGLGMQCTVTVVNNLDLGTGATSSTVTVTECHGAANTAPSSCTGPTVISSTELVTSVSQCNSSLDGGGASLECTVTVTNNIVGAATAVPATINQCNDSLTTGDVRLCSPDGLSTTSADIAQCNNSANGGGSSLTCSVTAGSTTSAALSVTVSQCNYSANGGGSTVICSTSMTTTITPAGTGGTGGPGTGGTGAQSPALPATGPRVVEISTLPALLIVTIGALLLLHGRLRTRTAAAAR